jgi:putative transposase
VRKKVGKHPTDHRKHGTKRCDLTNSHGIPLGVAVDVAIRHDMKLVDATLEALMVKCPEPTVMWPQHLCLDKGYDYDTVRESLEAWGIELIFATEVKHGRPSVQFRATGHAAGWWSAPTLR